MTHATADMVTVPEVSRRLGIPLKSVYRLIERKRIPYQDVTEPWHERKQYRLDVEAVRSALGMREAS